MKPEKRTVDDRLPKWLHSKILSAVDWVWQGKQMSMEESVRRIKAVDDSGQFTDEEMSWIMLMLIIPKAHHLIKNSDEWRNFQAEKKASVH